ncbi:MAG: hypothetical protein P8176_16520, partial [Gammaproteobacteria bacterium]
MHQTRETRLFVLQSGILGRALASIGLALLVLPAQAAFKKDAAVSLEASYEDNAEISSNPNSNTAFILGGYFDLSQDSARFKTNVNLSLRREINNDADNRTLPSGSLDSRWVLAKDRLFWVVNDTVQQTRVNAFELDTRRNSSTTNALSTGPDLVVPFGVLTQWRTSARRDRIDYSNGAQMDRERDSASTTLSRTWSPRWSTDLSRNWEWETFTAFDRDVVTDTVGLNFNGNRISWRVATGQTDIDSGQLESDVHSANVRYRFTSTLSFVASYNRAFRSDISEALQLADQRLSNIQFL